MVWPASDVNTTQMDAGTDTPPRAEFLSWAQKFNQLRNHVSAFMQGLLTSADAAAARTTLGATTTGAAVFTAADAAAARTAIAAPGTGVANTFTGANTFTSTLLQQSASEAQIRAEKTGAGASLSILFNSETQIGVFDSVSGMLWVLDKATGALTIPRAAVLDGFARIGSPTAPPIKQYYFTGTTAAAGGSVSTPDVDVNTEDIIDFQVLVSVNGTVAWVDPQNTVTTNRLFHAVVEAQAGVINSVRIYTPASGGSDIASRPYRCFITVRQR